MFVDININAEILIIDHSVGSHFVVPFYDNVNNHYFQLKTFKDSQIVYVL